MSMVAEPWARLPAADGTVDAPFPNRCLFPLMCGQRWLVHLWESAPQFARPVQRIHRLRKGTNTVALLAAFRHVVGSHPSLRLRLVKTPHGWRQSFPEWDAEIAGVRIVGKTPAYRAAYAQHLLAEDSATALDLRRQRPFIAKVLDVDGDLYWSLCLDHIAADDLASDVLERSITAAYWRMARDEPVLPANDAAAFFDCLARETANAAAEATNLAYWREQLRGVPVTPKVDDGRPWTPGAIRRWRVEDVAYATLIAASRRYRCSVFTMVVATQVCLIDEFGTGSDIVLNIPVSNRTRIEDFGVIANLSMLLHVRFNRITRKPVKELIAEVRLAILQAMAHRQFDYSALHDVVSRDASAHGGEVQWRAGCSYIHEREILQCDHPLFEERLDNQRSGNFDTLRGAFSLGCRHRGPCLHFEAEWDPAAWAISPDQMENGFLRSLGALMEQS